MLKRIYFILTCLLFAGSINAQKLSVNLTEELVIGDDENASSEYLFVSPTQICIDSQHNIYVADYNRGEVRVFSQQGKYIKSVGRKGKGPGEILEVLSMTIDKHDNLIIVDRSNDRFTVFTDFGSNFKVYPMTVDHVIDAFTITPLNSEEYLLYHLRKIKNKGLFTTAKDKLLHVYSKDFSSIKVSFMKAGEICEMDDPFLLSMVGKGGSKFCVLSPDTIIFAPEFYDGTLFRYICKNRVWNLTKLHGQKPGMKSYKMLNRNDYPDRKYPSYSIYTSGPMGKFLVLVQNKSLGIFVLEDGRIIHFTRQRISKFKWIMVAELFERNGRFIGSGEVKDNLTVNFDAGDTPIFNDILCYSNGLVYGNALKNYSPIVRVARLVYKISE